MKPVGNHNVGMCVMNKNAKFMKHAKWSEINVHRDGESCDNMNHAKSFMSFRL